MAERGASIDRIGKLMFGRPSRLHLLLWIVQQDGKLFYQGEAVAGTGLASSAVSQELGQLEELEMLMRMPTGSDRRVFYERTNSSLWAVAEAATEAIKSLGLIEVES